MDENEIRKPGVKYIIKVKLCKNDDIIIIPVNAKHVKTDINCIAGYMSISWLEPVF